MCGKSLGSVRPVACLFGARQVRCRARLIDQSRGGPATPARGIPRQQAEADVRARTISTTHRRRFCADPAGRPQLGHERR